MSDLFFDDEPDLSREVPEQGTVGGPIGLVWGAVASLVVAAIFRAVSDSTGVAVVGYFMAIVVVSALVMVYRASRAKLQANDGRFVASHLADGVAGACLLFGLLIGLWHGWTIAFAIAAWLETR